MTPRELAALLRAATSTEIQASLASDPVRTIQRFGIKVEPFDFDYSQGDCSCDGIYHQGPPKVIGYRPTPGSRRGVFTLNHEYCHALIKENDEILSHLADMGDDGGREAEEKVCDAFAAAIVIPEQAVSEALHGEKPHARHVGELYDRSHGSREACAVRLAEQLPYFGYVVIADPTTKTIRFASPSPTTVPVWRRGTRLAEGHRLWSAARQGEYRGEGNVEWPSGEKRSLWMDAVAFRSEVHAVFTDHRYWSARGVSILDGGARNARPTSYQGTCGHCGSHKWGYTLHEQCEETWCRKCGRCGCGAPPKSEPETKQCGRCGVSKRAHLFPSEGQVCRDCIN